MIGTLKVGRKIDAADMMKFGSVIREAKRMSTTEVVRSNKDLVREALLRMPEDVSLEQISEEIAILAAINAGEEDVKQGRLIPHDEVVRRLAEWTSK
jgi:predicted transcriptional regulator